MERRLLACFALGKEKDHDEESRKRGGCGGMALDGCDVMGCGVDVDGRDLLSLLDLEGRHRVGCYSNC